MGGKRGSTGRRGWDLALLCAAAFNGRRGEGSEAVQPCAAVWLLPNRPIARVVSMGGGKREDAREEDARSKSDIPPYSVIGGALTGAMWGTKSSVCYAHIPLAARLAEARVGEGEGEKGRGRPICIYLAGTLR